MKKIFLLAACLVWMVAGNAQEARQNSLPKVAKRATVNLSQLGPDFRPQMANLEAPAPGGEGYRSWLLQRKQEIFADYQSQPSTAKKAAGSAPKPIHGTNYQGNIYSFSVPNDNDCAISNGGYLVSVINTNIYIFDSTGTNVQNVSLANFSTSLGITGSKYDPKVTYDPKADRFIMVYLNGFDSTTSEIIIAFSETNDPTQAWNLYSIEGNPLDDGTWTDYPIIGMTDKEFILTGNLLATGQSWQLGFRQSIIWQIDKDNGYNGDSLSMVLWTDIKYGGKSIRNLLPIQSGSSTVGPDMYLISNRNFDTSNDSVFIIHLTDTIGAPGATVTTDVKISSTPYGVPPSAQQKFNQWLQTNDSRWLGGFLENDRIQFVGNCVNPENGLAGFYHGIIDNVSSTMDVSGTIIGDSTLDFGYPNIAYTGLNAGENGAIIGFNHTSIDTSAGFSAIFYDGTDYSERVHLKRGSDFINVLTGSAERWGDYSGCQRKYNEPGKVWVSGTFSRTNKTPGTWISELIAPPSVGRYPEAEPKSASLNAWPVPAWEMVNVEFELENSQMVEIGLYDLKGQKVQELWRDRAKPGLNFFTFSTDPLPNGIYFLNIKGQNEVFLSKKIVVTK